jgi:hypothetical protein
VVVDSAVVKEAMQQDLTVDRPRELIPDEADSKVMTS